MKVSKRGATQGDGGSCLNGRGLIGCGGLALSPGLAPSAASPSASLDGGEPLDILGRDLAGLDEASLFDEIVGGHAGGRGGRPGGLHRAGGA